MSLLEPPDGNRPFRRIDFAAIGEIVRREFACDHAASRVTRFVASNNISHFRRQCLDCGANVESVRKSTIAAEDLDAMPAFDPGLISRWNASRDARYEELRREAQEELAAAEELLRQERKDWYAEYLSTPHWKEIRRRVIERSRGRCEGCGIRPATQVHHLTYDRVGCEMLFDLVAVCDPCHNTIHGIGGVAESTWEMVKGSN